MPYNVPSITRAWHQLTDGADTRHGTAWDCDQYQRPGLWHKSLYLMTPALSWHNVTQCVTLSRMLSWGVRRSLILCMIVEGHIQNSSYNCNTIATLRHLHDLNISHISSNRFPLSVLQISCWLDKSIRVWMMSVFEEDIFWKWYNIIHSLPPNWDNDSELIWI